MFSYLNLAPSSQPPCHCQPHTTARLNIAFNAAAVPHTHTHTHTWALSVLIIGVIEAYVLIGVHGETVEQSAMDNGSEVIEAQLIAC